MADLRAWLRRLRRVDPGRSVASGARTALAITRIVYEPDGMLRFDCGPQCHRLRVEPDDHAAFVAILHQEESFVEFRAADGVAGESWYLLVLDGGDKAGQWRGGALIARRAPSFAGRFSPPDAMATMSALVSDFRHELRQPITAISLAAHNGTTKLRSGQTDKALAKFDTILDHVDRCDEIFGRSALGMYADSFPAEDVDVHTALLRAVGDLRPAMLFAGIGLRIRGGEPGFTVSMPRGGADMMARALIGQAVDAILARRAADGGACGTILVERRTDRSGLFVRIEDDGMPIQPGSTREGLALSMARYLIGRGGGTIGYDGPAAATAAAGAACPATALTVRLPYRTIGLAATARREPIGTPPGGQEFATSLR